MGITVRRGIIAVLAGLLFVGWSGTAPASAATLPVRLTTKVTGDTVAYHVSNVPNTRVGPVTLRGTCLIALADAVRALPLLPPLLIDYGSGNDVNVGPVLAGIIERGVLVRQSIRIANSNDEITNSFVDVPRGLYVGISVCGTAADIAGIATGNFDFTRDQVGITPTIVVNMGSGSDSGSGSGSAAS